MNTERPQQNISEVSLKSREKLTLTGVDDIISFDDSNIYLETKSGRLLIYGTELKIISINTETGDMSVSGYVCSLAYNDKQSGKGGGIFSGRLKK